MTTDAGRLTSHVWVDAAINDRKRSAAYFLLFRFEIAFSSDLCPSQ